MRGKTIPGIIALIFVVAAAVTQFVPAKASAPVNPEHQTAAPSTTPLAEPEKLAAPVTTLEQPTAFTNSQPRMEPVARAQPQALQSAPAANPGSTASVAAVTIGVAASTADTTTERGHELSLPEEPARKLKPSAIPPGFEALFEDRTSLVDIYYAGRYIGSAMATFNPDTIHFENPAALVEKMPNLLSPELINKALTGELPTNQEFRCYYQGQRNCGVLEPETAGVIFSEDNFRADIFVNQYLLSVQEATADKYLPASDSGFSYLQTLNYAFTGTEDDTNEEDNLFTTSLFSYRENAIRMDANYSDDKESYESDFQIDTLVGQRDWRGIRYLGGYFQTINEDLRFTRESGVAGIRIGTSLDTREDQRQSAGREIQVFLQSRGEVSIFKDGRLVSTRIYDAGNQILDTADLPGGSYDIELRIRDAGGERNETMFYVKNASLPPAGDPRYFVELGRVTEYSDNQTLPETIDLYLLRGSINTRLNYNNSVITGLSTTEDDTVAELGWFGLGNHYEVLVNTAFARHNRYGLNAEARFNFRRAWLTTNYRKIWDDSSGFDPLTDDPDYGDLNLIGDEQEQLSASLSFPVSAANVSFGSRYLDREDSDSVTDYHASVDLEVFRMRDSNIRFRLQYNHNDTDDFVVASLNWRMGKDHWSLQVTPEYEYNDIDGDSDNFSRLGASANWDSRDKFSSDLRAGVTANIDDDFNAYGANADWGGRYGRARGQVEHVDRDKGGSTTRHNGNLATSFMLTDGSAMMGGKDQNQAAVIIDLKGGAEDVFFDVLVNGGRRATARPGKKSVVSLRPFETYRISLRPRGDQFVYFNDKEYSVTLYPGNVVKLDWEADVVNIVFGRIKDQHGKPVANALLSGVAGVATTDDYGLFQAEVKTSAKSIGVETRNQQCQLTLPEYTLRKGIATLGTLHCEMTAK